MLDQLPFITKRIETRDRLLLVPFFHNLKQWNEVRSQALKHEPFLGSHIYHFEKMSVMTSFMGYPHLLTLLAGIGAWQEKRLFWLGTAGALNEDPLPDIVSVSGVRMTPELQDSWGSGKLSMNALDAYPARSVVTVDIPHRETASWLETVRRIGMERVEMELYPLRLLAGRPFTALLVGSDRVGADPKTEALPYRRLVESFSQAFTDIWEIIHET